MTFATDNDARTAVAASTGSSPQSRPPGHSLGRKAVGGFFLFTGAIHLVLVTVDPQLYGGFADQGLFPFVRDGWEQIVMAAPAVYGLLLMTGEIAMGMALLIGGRAARFGWVGVIAFHVLLLPFGWGIWFWAVPALAVLVPLAVIDTRRQMEDRS
jgi:hypothetical protein